MYILGLSAYHYDSSAALIKDGTIIGAVEEEKLTGRKHTGELPVQSIDYLLKEAGISFSDIDKIGFAVEPFRGLASRAGWIVRNLPQSLGFWRSHGDAWLKMVNIRRHLRRIFGPAKPGQTFHNINHHLCHASSCFLMSDFPEAAVMTIDGAGESTSGVMWSAQGVQMRPLRGIRYPHSLGYLYNSVTDYLGFRPNFDEGKVMALASYGRETYAPVFDKIVKLRPSGDFELDLSYFDFYRNSASWANSKRWVSKKFLDTFGPCRAAGDAIEDNHRDMAASLQGAVNRTVLHLGEHLYRTTGQRNLCMAGGVALNSVANGLLLRSLKFDRIFVQPAAGDGGVSLGAALYLWHVLLNEKRIHYPEKIFLGPSFSNDEIRTELLGRGLKHQEVEPAETAATLLSEGKIVGWFQGRAELGPRALGNRSILADPRRAEMKDILNRRVKQREPFRPFAPAILEERLTDYFDFHHPSPAMLLVYDVLRHRRVEIPAVTHVDGTGRVQTVSRRDNPLFYDLIEKFGRKTGVPVVLNTSLNGKGEPIACTPAQALDCFSRCHLDAIIMGRFLVTAESEEMTRKGS